MVRRAWLYCLVLALPALVAGRLCSLSEATSASRPRCCWPPACFSILLLVAAALIEGLIRPLQTLSNVVSSLREGDYSFRARGASAPDAVGELAAEVNALADLLQKQRVRSLEATALLARILEVMHAPLFAFDRDDTLQLVNNAGLKLLGLPNARCFGRTARELGLEDLLRAPDQSIHSFGRSEVAGGPARWLLRKAAFRQEGVPHTLLLLADVSLPLQEEEQIAWKRLIRVLGHELSNSLAPIKSIAGSLLARVDNLARRRRHAARFSPRARRRREPRRIAASLCAVLPPARPVAAAAASAGFSSAPLLERVVLLEQRLPVQLDPGPAGHAQCRSRPVGADVHQPACQRRRCLAGQGCAAGAR